MPERLVLGAIQLFRDNPWALVLSILLAISFLWASRDRAQLAAQMQSKVDTADLNNFRRDVLHELADLKAQNDTTNRMLRRMICRNTPHPDFCP